MKHLIVISGPTASGKTGVAVQLAQHFDTCVLSADSRQCYKEASIGTAKPSKEEQSGVPHFFIDSHVLEDAVTAADYERFALQILENEFKDNDIVVLAGGSGMFVDALCLGLDDIPTDKDVKQELIAQFEVDGITPLLNELKEKDPDYFHQVDKDNVPRVQRALEAIRVSGKTYSELRLGAAKNRSFTTHRFVLNHDRELLYDRINQRVDVMLEEGLEDEARSLIQFRHLTSMNTVGYKELFSYFDGNCTFEEAVSTIKQNSRRYAKRQLTWLRRHPESHWVEFTNTDAVVREILTIFKAKE